MPDRQLCSRDVLPEVLGKRIGVLVAQLSTPEAAGLAADAVMNSSPRALGQIVCSATCRD